MINKFAGTIVDESTDSMKSGERRYCNHVSALLFDHFRYESCIDKAFVFTSNVFSISSSRHSDSFFPRNDSSIVIQYFNVANFIFDPLCHLINLVLPLRSTEQVQALNPEVSSIFLVASFDFSAMSQRTNVQPSSPNFCAQIRPSPPPEPVIRHNLAFNGLSR